MHIVSLVFQSVLLWLLGTLAVIFWLFFLPDLFLMDGWDGPYRATILEIWDASAPDSFECETPRDTPYCLQFARFWDNLKLSPAGETQVYVRIWALVSGSLTLLLLALAAAYYTWRDDNRMILMTTFRMPTWAVSASFVFIVLALVFIIEEVAL